MDTIVLNAMFVGSYGKDNIDGEIINFYLDDNGVQNYFVPEYGTLPKEIEGDDIKAILMVSKIKGDTFEVIGKYVPKNKYKYHADHKKEKEDLAQSVKYDGVPITDIYKVITTKKFSRVTFKGGNVFFLKKGKKIILTGNSDECKKYFPNDQVFQLDEYKNKKWGSKNYRIFSKDEKGYYKNKGHQMDDTKAYDVLIEIIEDNSIWEENKATVKINKDSLDELKNKDFLGINHIIDGANVELLSSNWLAHYIEIDENHFSNFFGISNPGDFVAVKREEKNIDILVEFSNCVVVIENKIKSGIVKESAKVSCQLEKYYNYVETNKDYKEKEKKYIILCPDYEKSKIEKQKEVIVEEWKTKAGEEKAEKAREALKEFKIKTYSELKSQLKENCPSISDAKYYEDFLDFVDVHSANHQHYEKRKLSEKRFFHNIANLK